MKIFSGTSNLPLSHKVAEYLDKKLADVELEKFADGEFNVKINQNVRKEDCFIIQPTGPSEFNSPNDNFMELLILADALKRGSASSVTIVMPYYGYQRQDRKDYSRAPISARVIASCLEALNIDRVITFDLHAGQIQGFFSNDTPFDNLYVETYFVKYINKKILNCENSLDDIIIVSPDEGGMKRAVRIANKLGVGTATIYKERIKANEVCRMSLMGDIEGKICIIVDDMIDTAGTACTGAKLLKDKGATSIYIFACHGLFSGPAIDRINNSVFDKVIITNTLNQEYKNLGEKFDIIDISYMCGEAIRRSLHGESLKELYDTKETFPKK